MISRSCFYCSYHWFRATTLDSKHIPLRLASANAPLGAFSMVVVESILTVALLMVSALQIHYAPLSSMLLVMYIVFSTGTCTHQKTLHLVRHQFMFRSLVIWPSQLYITSIRNFNKVTRYTTVMSHAIRGTAKNSATSAEGLALPKAYRNSPSKQITIPNTCSACYIAGHESDLPAR